MSVDFSKVTTEQRKELWKKVTAYGELGKIGY